MNEHYFTEKPTSSFNLRSIKVNIKDLCLTFSTGSGIFSPSRLDPGTRLLIESATVTENTDVLDLGCGYGAVGITFAHLFPTSRFVLSDINERAIKLSKKNAYGLSNVEIVKSNVFSELLGRMFDAILINPPQNAGREICFQMVEESATHLQKNGRLYVVARHNKGGKMLSLKMKDTLGNVESIAKQGSYRVYESEK